MNINLVAFTKSDQLVENTGQRLKPAVNYLRSIFGGEDDHIARVGKVWAYNTDRMSGTWSVPTWFETRNTLYGVSQPPIPTNSDVGIDDYPSQVHEQIWGSGTPSNFLMNNWGYAIRPGGKTRLWTDFIGISRCYFVETSERIVYSNHIGALSFFLDESLDLDHEALELFANFGWFMGNSTPYKQVTRVPGAMMIEFDSHAGKTEWTYEPFSDLVSSREKEADFSSILEPTRTAARNLDRLSQKVPTVYLSGGQDSRMSAALWLSGGSDANVVTFGNLSREAEIATELISRYPSGPTQTVNHRVSVSSASDVTMPLHERLNKAHQMWDGDAAPTNMRRNIVVPAGGIALSIGGSNGEVARCHLYGEQELEQYSAGSKPAFDRLFRSYPGRAVTAHAAEKSREFLEREYEIISAAGVTGLVSVDAFYVRQKLRRWSNQQLLTTAAILLGSREFVRMSYDLTVRQRIDRVSPRRIVDLAIPEWKGVPFYKGNVTDAQKITRRGIRIWLTDSEEFSAYMDAPEAWDNYLRSDMLAKYRSLIPTGDANRAHESWFQRAIWIDSIEQHRKSLNEISKNARLL